MQRKLVAFVLAALASGAVFAQSNVQVYGVVDVGFSHRGDNVNRRVGSQNAIDSGISSGTRIGFKGAEDLGSGLKVLWTLEAGFAADTGEHKQNDRLFGRQAFVGLSGAFGTALAGRQDAPFHNLLSDLDPFHGGTVGRYRNTFAAGANTGGENLFEPYRLDNAVLYTTPDFSGLSIAVAYSNNAIGQEAVGNAGDYRILNIVPRYTNGALSLGVSWHRIQSEDGDNVNIHNWMLGGAYDFGVVKLSAFYDENKWNDAMNVANNDLKLKDWMIGLTAPFGKHAIQAAYNQSRLSWHDDSGKARQWSLGYTYTLSRRTSFYAAIADLHNDKSRKTPGLLSTRAASLSDTDNPGNGYQSGFQFGVKQVF
ncbi:MAG: porin [Zoogloeaceae bacterium]|jgi:predicted porin|nr:porin [Zoogloeaceae bacterium]